MDGSRFDAWTRRQIGLVAGGLAATLLSVVDLRNSVEAKKLKCRKLKAPCQPKGKRTCCGKKRVCDIREGTDSTSCCKKLGASCVPGECCNFETGSGCVEGVCILI
jgi:hypothetical protein